MSVRAIRVDVTGDEYDWDEIQEGEAVNLPQIDRGVFDDSFNTNMVTDFDEGTYQQVDCNNHIVGWTTTNRPPNTGTEETREAIVRVYGIGSTNLAFSASWTWMGSAPTTLASGKVALLYLLVVGPDETDVIARWEVEA